MQADLHVYPLVVILPRWRNVEQELHPPNKGGAGAEPCLDTVRQVCPDSRVMTSPALRAPDCFLRIDAVRAGPISSERSFLDDAFQLTRVMLDSKVKSRPHQAAWS